MVSYIAFALTRDDNIFLLLSYMIIFPAYLIVLSKLRGMSKIGSYLYVFHEKANDSVFKWETRNTVYRKKDKKGLSSYIISYNFPFLFVSISVAMLFFYSTKWKEIYTIYECKKVIICMSFIFILALIMYKNRKIGTI